MQEDIAYQTTFGKFTGHCFCQKVMGLGRSDEDSSSSLASDQYVRNGWASCVGQQSQTVWFIVFDVKRKQASKKDSWLHKHKVNKLMGMLYRQQESLRNAS